MGEFEPQSEEELEDMVNFKSPEQEATVEVEKRKPFDAVIVLGAGVGDPLWKKFQERYPEGSNPRGVDIQESEGTMLGIDAKMRTIAAAEMYIQGLTSEIIFTGGRTAEKRGIDYSEAEVMKRYAGKLLKRAGISDEEIESAIILEEQATNTIENIANVCNMIDEDPEEYQHLAILTNEYHLDRAQELISKFNLQAEGFRAEDLLRKRSEKYDKVVDKFFSSDGYQKRLDGEKRWSKGLTESRYARYWVPQAITVDNPDRIRYIIESIGLNNAVEEFGEEGVVKVIKESSRVMPPERK